MALLIANVACSSSIIISSGGIRANSCPANEYATAIAANGTLTCAAAGGGGGYTANRALVSDGSGNIAAATTTATEIGYVNGVTSAIQTQLNGKVTGPASATDTALAVFDGTTGSLLKNSAITYSTGSGYARLSTASTSIELAPGSTYAPIRVGQVPAGVPGFGYGSLTSTDGSIGFYNDANSRGTGVVVTQGDVAAQNNGYLGANRLTSDPNILVYPFEAGIFKKGIYLTNESNATSVSAPFVYGEIKVKSGTALTLSADAKGIDIATTGTKPTCNSTNRGQLFFEEGVTGGGATADVLYMCMKAAADTYAWETVKSAP